MSKLTSKHWRSLQYGDKLPRKAKKAILGKKMGKQNLRARLSKVVVTQNDYPDTASLSDMFCPKCGCDVSVSTGNMAEYPERWVKETCARCGFLVCWSDNSPYYHCLEFKESNYESD